jgi:DUF4097 and DUF4098 domain-containing protein YvlB
MPVRRSIGTIFWAITLIALSVLLLARHFGYNIPIWPYVVRYWPALLIVWGVLKPIDYYRFEKSDTRQPLFSGSEVALLVFVIFAGAAATTAASLSSDSGAIFEVGDADLWDITGNNFTFDEHEEATVPDGSTIEIVNLFGDVKVRSSDNDLISLDVKKTIRASDKDEAERLSKDFTFSISNDGDKYRIASDRVTPRQRYKSSLVLKIPKRSRLRVSNRNGNVEVADLSGNQDISNRFGAVEVRQVTGDVTVSNSFGRITVENVHGRVEVQARNSDVFMSFDKRVQKDVQLSTRFGKVTIELPSDSSFRIDAHTQFGRIDSDFESLQKSRSDVAKESAQGQIGQGGPQITISTLNGNIHLVRRSKMA